MTNSNFDGLEEHQREHAYFKRRFNEIYIMYEQSTI